MRGDALRFYQTLHAATRANAANSLAAIPDHFSNPQLQEVHVLKLEQLKFDSKKDTPEIFLVSLPEKALRAYPTPELAVPDPIDPRAADAAKEAPRHARKLTQRQQRVDSVRDKETNKFEDFSSRQCQDNFAESSWNDLQSNQFKISVHMSDSK